MKKSKILAPVVAVVAALSLAACNAADTASRNISYESDNFKVMRRIVFVNGITDRGSVVISGTLGPFLKVNDGYWVRTAPAVSKKLWSDLDLVNELINEYEDNDYIATVIDPGLE